MENRDPLLLRGDFGHGAARIALAALLFLTPVVFWRGGLEPFELCKVAVVQLTALALLVTGGLLLCNWFGQARRGSASLGQRLADLTADPVSRVMLLGLLAALLATINSISPLTSWQGVYENEMGLETTLALIVIFFAMRAVVRDAADIRLFLGAIAFALVPVTLYALVQIAGRDPFEWDQTSPFAGWTRPIGTLGHPNYLAGYLVMALPLILWLTIQCARERRLGITLALTLLFTLGSVVVIASLSRSAWLAAGLAALMVMFVQVCCRRAGGFTSTISTVRKLFTSRGLRWMFVILAVCLTGGVIAAISELPAPLRERIRHVAVMDARWPIWYGAWSIFAAHPWTGCGLETFDIAFRQHGLADYWRIEWGIIPTRAHNDLLHTLATQGLPGGIAFLLLAGTLAWAACRAWRLGQDRALSLSLAAAILAWYVQNFFGFPVTPTATLFVVLAAWLSRLACPVGRICNPSRALEDGLQIRPTGKTDAPIRPKAQQRGAIAKEQCSVAPVVLPALRAAILLAGVTAAWQFVARPYIAGCQCHRGTDLLSTDPDAALACHERAVRLDPRRDMLWIELCRCARVAADQRSKPEQRRRLLQRSFEAIDQACRLVPPSGQNLAIRARILHALAGDGLARPEEVLAAFDEATRFDPENAVLMGEAASAAIALGLHKRGLEYIDRGMQLDPSLGIFKMSLAALALAKNRFGEAEKLLGEATTQEWHDNAEGFNRARMLLCWTYLNTGRCDAALQLADDLLLQNDSLWTIHSLRAQALEKLGRRQEALGEYRRVASVRPDHAGTLSALARLRGSQ